MTGQTEQLARPGFASLFKWYFWLLVAILLVPAGICLVLSARYYDVSTFASLKTYRLVNRHAILVRGHVMGSMLCVGKIKHREQGAELNIRMQYRLICPKQRNGDFEVEIPVSATVRRVTYGDERTALD